MVFPRGFAGPKGAHAAKQIDTARRLHPPSIRRKIFTELLFTDVLTRIARICGGKEE
jgi:hypothetical protein